MIIVSIGGNAIIKRGERGLIEEQFENLRKASAFIAALSRSGRGIIITHGNGPIVGNIIIRNEAAKNVVAPMPLYICDADSEGGIGFMVQQSIYNQLNRTHGIRDVAAVVTQVVVDRDDTAFKNPSKPVGPYYTKEEAENLQKTRGWAVVEDSHRGWRRVVPSPRPKRIVESAVVKRMASQGVIVIAAGGGGVPVVEDDKGFLSGVDAVIDKDLATSLLGKDVKAAEFINLTQIDRVYINFGKPEEKWVPHLTLKEAKRYFKEGEFAPGSMGPKIEAAIDFIEGGGKKVIITSPEAIEDALVGRAGTVITE